MPVVDGGSKMNLITSYALGEDSNINYGRTTWLAQTFPLADFFNLWRCRLKLWTVTGEEFYHFALRNTDGAGKPTGADIAHTTLSPIDEYWYSPGKWRRFDFDEFPGMGPGTYALVMSVPDSPQTWGYKARADATTPRYTGGKAWKSTDSGETWEEIPGTDFYFEVWGYRPPPVPPPPPVIGNWAAYRVDQIVTQIGYKIVVHTDNKCHLWMRWTTVPPQKHIDTLIERGVPLDKIPRYCFVVYRDNEQMEAGDTLTHTFIKEPWPECETRWFYFYGSKQTEDMPSESPIFEKHRYAPPPSEWTLIILEPWTHYYPPFVGTRIILEPWTHYYRPFVATLIILEPWGGQIPPLPDYFVFYEPWGATLTENNLWTLIRDPDPCGISFTNGIITLDFTGTGHSGITCNLTRDTAPLRDPAGRPLHILTYNTEAQQGTPADRIVNMACAFKEGTGILLYLMVKQPPLGWGSGDYGYEWSPPLHSAWLYIGTGTKDIDLLAFFQRAAVDLGIDPDPEGWYITFLEIAHRDVWPWPTSWLKNDYIGLYY